ncbi:MAG: hypothetical protein AAF467_26225 [Actinomycetota bacterium]
MGEVLIALAAGLIGALIGLAGTLLNLRHERELERQKWIRGEAVESVAAFLASVNEVWRSEHSGGRPLDASDGPWVDCANAYDRATMVVTDDRTLELLDELWEAALTIRWEDVDDKIWNDEIWPLMHSLKVCVRTSLGTAPDAPSGARGIWRPAASRLPGRDRRLQP